MDDLFFNIDTAQTIPSNKFHVSLGHITTNLFGKQKSALSFTYTSADSFKIFANITMLKRTTFGNHILRSSGRQSSVLYVEGYLHAIKL